eukprot:gnl/Trimastix_PCT/4330.p1 GENE.gnl/Trimastix_PCT/4330~~gnl/Trimastix_PCT/4330.p1  ORF type:complete len:320 (+),score=53.15 gnl/Trimastix_PCT/4330:40-999(+)
MAERKAVNKYYPPNWDPSKGSLNKFRHSHPLRHRARKLKTEGILIIRFEMPWNMYCAGCGRHIAQGVRYNAQKKVVGNYFSTKILNFRFRCHLCENWIEIQTDPKNGKYDLIKGGRRKIEEFDPEDAEIMQFNSAEVREKVRTDAMFALEHKQKDAEQAKAKRDFMERLQETRDAEFRDDFASNQLLRKRFREHKNEDKRRRVKAQISLKRPLLASTQADDDAAKSAPFCPPTIASLTSLKKAAPILPQSTTSQFTAHQRRLETLRKLQLRGVKTAQFRPLRKEPPRLQNQPLIPTEAPPNGEGKPSAFDALQGYSDDT